MNANELNNGLALVTSYFGEQFPKYIKKNLKVINRDFKNCKKFFLSDNESSLKIAKRIGWETIQVDLEEEVGELSSLLLHDARFRYGYWFKVIGRILVLNKVIEKGFSILQIEADVRLFQNFPFEKVYGTSNGIAYTLHTKATGSAAVLFLKEMSDFDFLKEQFLEEFRLNGLTNDMEILGKIWRNYPEKITVLPTISNCGHQANSEIGENYFSDAIQKYPHFGGVFDDLSYGLFLFGIDPRNNKGRRVLFKANNGQLVTPKNITLRYFKGRLFVKCEACHYEFFLFNLHVHSKNPKIFSRMQLTRVLNKTNRLDKSRERTEFTTNVVSRKLKGIRDSIIRNLKH